MNAHALDLARVERVHLVGIGGMHMSAIASILLARGVVVSGSDLALSRYTERLEREGATIYAGHLATNLRDAQLVVTTVAAKDDNPELAAARARGIPIWIRAEMVAALMQLDGRQSVCIAGTHGKTTTSSLIAFALSAAGRAPAYLLGGDAVDLGRNAAPGTGAQIVVEADEYAEAFLHYAPDLAVVLNVEVDHLDYYGTEERVVEAFAAFMARVKPGGTLIACADSPRLRAILETDAQAPAPRILAQVHTYGLDREAEWTAVVEQSSPEHVFTVRQRGQPFGRFVTPLAGRHNVANCTGAIAALHQLGLSTSELQQAIARFHGARRRFELVGEANAITVIDDYAHHPTEIAATLAAAHERFPNRRIVIVFQPHTFSRTGYLLEGFRDCFQAADKLLLLQTYAAREQPADGIDAHALAAALRPVPPVVEDQKDAVAWLLTHATTGDVVITCGAGNVDGVSRALLAALRR